MSKLDEVNNLVLKELIYRYHRKILETENETLAELKAMQRYLTSIHVQLGDLITLLDSLIERKLRESEGNE